MKKSFLFLLLLAVHTYSFGFKKESVKPQLKQGLAFTENKGQITDQYHNKRTDIQFKMQAKGLAVFVGSGQIHYQFTEQGKGANSATELSAVLPAPQGLNSYRTDVRLLGANKNAKIITEDRQAAYERYCAAGKESLTAYSYKKITYQNIYPNIDWVLYVKDNKLEYDFVLKPGACVADIKIKYDGATSLALNSDGSLNASTPMGKIGELAPYSYVAEKGNKVSSKFVLRDGILGFQTAAYKGTLVIDPTLVWGTYFGGSDDDGCGNEGLTTNSPTRGGMAMDKWGYVYITGNTQSTNNIATAGSYQDSLTGGNDAFLAKFSSDGHLVWATYYGGSDNDFGESVACDTAGNVYLGGFTTSLDGIASANALQPVFGGSPGYLRGDGFLAKFDSSGSFQWGTYYGGLGADYVYSVRCDHAGAIYIAGETSSIFKGTEITTPGSIATPGSFMDTVAVHKDAGFLAKFNSAGQREWGTYFGGNNQDGVIRAMACDSENNIYIAGATTSDSGIATSGTYLELSPSRSSNFLAKFNGAGNRIWGTYDSQNYGAVGTALNCDRYGNVYMTGITVNPDDTHLITPGVYGNVYGGGLDAFIAKFNASNGSRSWGSYYGGTGDDAVEGITTDLLGNVYIAGYTGSYGTDIATADGLYSQNNGWGAVGFFAKLDSSGKNRIWGSFYGQFIDQASDVICDNVGNVYIAGSTSSTDSIATPDAYQNTLGGGTIVGDDAFLIKIYDCVPPAAAITASGPTVFCEGDSVVLRADTSTKGLSYQWQLNGSNISNATQAAYTVKDSGTYTLVQSNMLQCADTSTTDTITIHSFSAPIVNAHGDTLSTGTYVTYQWYVNGDSIQGATQQTYIATTGGHYTVVVTDSNGCSKESNMIPLGVANVSAISNQIHIYPNPASTVFYVTAPVSVTVSVSSVEGKEILREEQAKEVNIGSLASGVYMIKVTDQNGILLKMDKLIKTNQ